MIFNSLGSNYNLKFVVASIFSLDKKSYTSQLEKYLAKRYGGKTILLYKGREALKLALQLASLPKGSKVGMTGFSCYVVYQAIIENGLTPVFIDIGKRNLNFELSELNKHKNLKALIIQNTLGEPCDMGGILKYCKANGIIVIEDLAHSVGIKYKTGQEAGTVGDFAALSFSQDKMIDSVSGGALVIRNKNFINNINLDSFIEIDWKTKFRDRFYPLFTFLIRQTYFLKVGKLLHYVLKKAKLLSQPLPEKSGIEFQSLSGWYCKLASIQFSELTKSLRHKERLTDIYQSILGKDVRGIIRYPFLTEKRSNLISFLESRGVYVSDIWYDAPIAPKKYLKQTTYSSQCKNSEYISEQILNLPTHINTSKKDAYRIARLIKTWQTTN